MKEKKRKNKKEEKKKNEKKKGLKKDSKGEIVMLVLVVHWILRKLPCSLFGDRALTLKKVEQRILKNNERRKRKFRRGNERKKILDCKNKQRLQKREREREREREGLPVKHSKRFINFLYAARNACPGIHGYEIYYLLS